MHGDDLLLAYDVARWFNRNREASAEEIEAAFPGVPEHVLILGVELLWATLARLHGQLH